MEVHTIPIEDRFIIYRPLLKLAFIGNRAMAEVVACLADEGCPCKQDLAPEVEDFLGRIGFFQPDPPAPPFPAREFKPTSAVLMLTNRCNLRCMYCYANAGVHSPKDLTFDLAQVVIDQAHQNAVEMGAKSFSLTCFGGGEPTHAWTLMKQSVAYTQEKSLPCRVSMVSNGIWSTHQREWITKNLSSLTISLDGGPTTQNRQRPMANGHESFEHVMRTVKALDETGFPYSIRMTATPPFEGVLAEDIRYLSEATQCPTFHVEPTFNTQRGGHQSPEFGDQVNAFVAAFMDAYDVAQAYERKLRYSGARPESLTPSFCNAPYSSLIVTADGDLTSCFEISDRHHPMSELSTIGHVVGGEIEIRHETRDGLLDYIESKQTDMCADCFCRHHCSGDCYTRTSELIEEALSPLTERCTINQQVTSHILLWNIMAGGGVWQGQNGHREKQPQAELLG